MSDTPVHRLVPDDEENTGPTNGTIRRWMIGDIPVAGVLEAVGFFALLAPLLLAMRALTVAHFDFSIAETLIVDTKSVPFIAATLVESAPAFLYAAGVLVVYRVGQWRRNGGAWGEAALPLLVGVVLVVPDLLASTIELASVEAAGVLVAFVLGAYTSWLSHAWGKLAILVIAMLYAIGTAVPLEMWIPAEEVITVDGKPETVYVLEESEESLTLFYSSSVAIRRVPAASVEDRQFCAPGARRSVGEYLLGFVEKGMPPCP
jgi:hypothetical protein